MNLRELAKTSLRFSSTLCVFPVIAIFIATKLLAGRDAAFAACSQFLCQLPGTTGVYLRNAFFRFASAGCDGNAFIGYGTIFSSADVTLGKSAYVGNYCSIGNVAIEDDVLIASHVSLMNGTKQHRIERLDVPVREQPGEFPRITIGQDSWVGEKAVVAANIGKHCVVGAGAVVLKDLPDYAIAVGVPAKIVGDRREQASSDGRSGEVNSVD